MAAAAPRAHANGKNPINSAFQSYFGGLEAFGHAYDPLMKSFARAQLEMAGFMSRRAQACLEVPQRLTQCRTPQDIANEQMRFWRKAFQDYTDSTRRITEAMAASLSVPSFGVAASDEDAETARDYITFPEAEPKEPRRGTRERKAA